MAFYDINALQMSLQRMTAGERRGLILLILLLLIATVLLTWRDNTVSSRSDGPSESSVESSAETSAEAGSAADAVSSFVLDDSVTVGDRRRRKAANSPQKDKIRPAPATRSPRDERVD